MITTSTGYSRLLPLWVGHPTQFGPHLLLNNEDFEVLWRLLKCRRCSFRRLYHKLVIKERKTSGEKPPHDFHSLTRAIKAVLNGLCLNRRYPTKVVLTSRQASVIPPADTKAHDCLTVLQTSVSLQKNFVVCPSHGRELFDHLYCGDSDSDSHVNTENALSFGLENRFRIPRGHSTFFSSLTRDESSDDDNNDENVNNLSIVTTSTKQNQTVHIVSLAGQCLFGTVQATIEDYGCNVNVGPCSEDLDHLHLLTDCQRITEANLKWSAFYETKEGDTPKSYSDSRLSLKNERHVRFSYHNPVSSVRYMRTYSVALSLERRNRIWEIEARNRVYARFLRLISSGCDPCKASELAERASDEEEEEKGDKNYSHSSLSHESSDPQTSNAGKVVRKKRSKRRKKTSKKSSASASHSYSWNVKSSNCPSFPTFYSNPISCQSAGPVRW